MKLSDAKQWLPIIQAAADGKTIQYKGVGFSNWTDCDSPSFSDPVCEYRIKPEAKLRPWRPEEVPMGCLIQPKDSMGYMYAPVAIIPNGVFLFLNSSNNFWSYSGLLKDAEHSTDGGKTWLPCGVTE